MLLGELEMQLILLFTVIGYNLIVVIHRCVTNDSLLYRMCKDVGKL